MSIRSKENIGKMYNFRFLDENRKITKSSIKQALLPPYPSRYYLNVIIFTVPSILIGLWHYGIIPEHKQGFFCKDPLYSHKYNGDTVAPWMLATVAIFLCFFIYFSIEKIRSKRINELISFVCLTQFYIYFKHFIIGLCLVGGVTEIAKLLVREHRPHFFDTCQPNTNENCTIGTVVLDYTCTNTADSYMDVLEASMSFPSGHSSISWYTALFLIYIVHSRMPTHKTGTGLKLLFLIICLAFSVTSSLTRITDRRHHWWDVVVGTLLGIIGAVYAIRIAHNQIKKFNEILILNEIEEKSEESIFDV